MERLGTVVARVLADTRRAMDKRKRKAGAGVEPSPGSLPRDVGGTILAGEKRRHVANPTTISSTVATAKQVRTTADA
jgi:hypothetical protein